VAVGGGAARGGGAAERSGVMTLTLNGAYRSYDLIPATRRGAIMTAKAEVFLSLNRENGEVNPFSGTIGAGSLIGRAATPTSFGRISYRCARSATLNCSRYASNAIPSGPATWVDLRQRQQAYRSSAEPNSLSLQNPSHSGHVSTFQCQ